MNPDVIKLNEERRLAVESGKDPYAGNLASISTFRNAPISSANLGQNPIVLPETTPSTKATGIIAGINNATQNDLTQQAVANAKATAEAAGVGEAQKQKQTALEYIKGLFGKETTAMQESQTSPEALQIQTENTTLTDLNNKITDENAKLKAEQDAIRARGDISKSAQEGLLANLEDTYGRRLADLSTRQANAIGNITRLKSSLKDSLDMKLAPIEKEIQYYKDFELENLKDLSTEEQKTLSNIIAEKTRLETQIKDSHKTLETALKSALDNGIKIPDDVVAQMQDDPENSYSILASNGISLENPLERQLKQANLYTESLQQQKLLKEISGTTPDQKTIDSKLQASNDIETLLANDQFNEIWGVQGYFKTLIPGSAAQLAKAQAQQVIDSLALAARGQLKGQGAVSDFEGKILKSAQTALNFNLSPEQAKKELIKVKGAIRTSSGLTATVKLTNPKTKETALVEVTQDGINKAITDGLQVEYQ